MSKRHKIIEYTLGEEIFSSITHGIGALFGVYATVYMVVISAIHDSPWAVVSGAIYGATLIILFSMSTLYHAISNRTAKLVFRILDHSTIFLLIAGTYTPVALITLRGPMGWVIFGVEWGVAILGIILNAISIERFKVFSMIGYIVCGWMVVIAAMPLVNNMAWSGVLYLLGGGLFYTIGLIFYKLKNIRYMHSVWHLFVLIGAVLQYITIAYQVLPSTF